MVLRRKSVKGEFREERTSWETSVERNPPFAVTLSIFLISANIFNAVSAQLLLLCFLNGGRVVFRPLTISSASLNRR